LSTQDTRTERGSAVAADEAPPDPRPAAPRPTGKALARRHRRSRWDVKLSPYLYISPFFILFALVGLYPLLYTGYLSLFEWDRFNYERGGFIGLENFGWVLSDPRFAKALVNTFSIFLISSVPQIIIAVAVAALLDNQLKGRTFWRMSVLLPFVVAPAAVVLIFGSLFADRSGVVNAVLGEVGGWIDAVPLLRDVPVIGDVGPIAWHADRWWSHVAIAGMVNWRWTGYNTLIILAAMQAVPRDVYESAALDGAGRIRQLVSVTLPMIRPTMIFVIVTSTIGGLQIFTEPRLFDDTPNREGGADHQFMTGALYVYVKGIEDQFYGRASAAAWLLFLVIIAIVVLNFAITRRLTKGAEK
jgi:cellobiose transport system permease protein